MTVEQVLTREAHAWRELPPRKYDRAVCQLFEEVDSAEEVLALAAHSLRRDGPALTESRACCAEHVLPLVTERAALLFLLAWSRLAAVAESGPDSVPATPDLPVGAVLPTGAEVTDPALRAEAEELAQRHRDLVARWNAKQRALGELRRLTAVFRAARGGFADQDVPRELAAAMALAPALPSDLRRLIQE